MFAILSLCGELKFVSKMATVTEEQILAVKEAAVPDNTKKSYKIWLGTFSGTVLLFLAVKLSHKPTQNDFVYNC